MKKLNPAVCFVFVILVIASYFTGNALGLSYDPSATYTAPATVVGLDETTDWTLLVDWNGEAWCIRDEGLNEGELVIVTFNDNGTDSIYDDVIVEVNRAESVTN